MLRVCCLALLVAMLPGTASFSLGVAPATHRFVAASQSQPTAALRARVAPVMAVKEEEKGEEKENMMQQVKDAGVAGIISYIFWDPFKSALDGLNSKRNIDQHRGNN